MALNSTSVIRVVDLLCEGPIAGLVGCDEGIFLEETAIRTGAERNFAPEDVSYDFKPGGRTQSQLEQGKDGTSTVNDVNVEIGKNYSETLSDENKVIARDYGAGQVTRQITDTDVESFELLFSIPRMFSTAQEGLAKGQLFNGSIQIAIDVQAQGEAFNTVYDRTITGIAVSDYQLKSPRINLSGQGPWNIRVRKVNLGENHFEVKFQNFTDIDQDIPIANGRGNQIFWTSLIELQSLRTAYPFCAVAGLSISTQQFKSLPTRAYKIRGRIVEVPSNSFVRDDGSLGFDGPFDGSLKKAWTTCPVCCWYDMATNSRYGAGDFVDASNLSWVDLYPLSQYSNQLVTNPDGTQEPRFACNTVIASRAEAFNVLQDLASVFRGMLYWRANTIQATADHGNLDGSSLSAVHLYTNSNVINGAFSYSGTSLKTRSTSIRVRYNDPENFFKSNVAVIEDAELISKYGYQVRELVGFGITSKFAAQRLGRWALLSEEIDGEVVTFTTGLQGAVVFPGQVFAVADEMRQGVRLAGRVSAATTSAITLDQTATLTGGGGDQLTCTLPDGSVETRPILSVAGSVANVQSFSAAPLLQSIWSISASNIKEQKFRCLSVSDNGDGQFTITGVESNDSIYSAADSGGKLEFEPITLLNETPAKPTNLNISARQIQINSETTNQAVVSWSRGSTGQTVDFELEYKLGDGNYTAVSTSNVFLEINGLSVGTQLTVRVRGVGVAPLRKRSPYVTARFTVPVVEIEPGQSGVTVLPPDPADVTIQASGSDQVVLRWAIPQTALNTDKFVAVIRQASQTDGTATWPNSTLLRTVEARTNYASLPLIEGEYLVKFESEFGQRSANAKSAVISLPAPIPRFDIQTRREDQDSPPFRGIKDGVFYDSDLDGLVLGGASTLSTVSTVDDVVDFDELSSVDDLSLIVLFGDRLPSGEYYFENVLDLGGVFSVLFERKLTTRGIYPDALIDDRTEFIDRWSDVDGDLADNTSADLFFRTSDQATVDQFFLLEDGDFLLLEDGDKIETESDIDFGAWTPMESGRYTGRQFQFRANLKTFASDQTPIVDELGFTVQLESRTESSATIASGAGAKTVTFAKAFYQAPSIGITAANLAAGDYYEITSPSASQFTITFKNFNNVAIDRNFQYQATGFGTEET